MDIQERELEKRTSKAMAEEAQKDVIKEPYQSKPRRSIYGSDPITLVLSEPRIGEKVPSTQTSISSRSKRPVLTSKPYTTQKLNLAKSNSEPYGANQWKYTNRAGEHWSLPPPPYIAHNSPTTLEAEMEELVDSTRLATAWIQTNGVDNGIAVASYY